jgi:aryl-alcohol dehydrogenase-like predicted oxidoreductase
MQYRFLGRPVSKCPRWAVGAGTFGDGFSKGVSEGILGAAIAGRREQVVLSMKITLRATDRSLQRSGTDHINLLRLHHFDAQIPAPVSA